MSSPAYRLGPRRGGRAGSRIDWERFARIVLVIVFVAVLLSYVRPALNLYGSWQESRAQGRELAELRRRNADLRLQADNLSGQGAVTEAARKRGMVIMGEKAYSVDLGRRR